ncbi:ABC transporter permease [Rhodobacteraceae bacterium RKSG542]|uniref:ABC transporter permease n=1 Tax=Pseudovibrio flavus TaxID=2529854 RepID=UPI0012BB92FD|nr:ABC transporter permease [Pseudovibrio flavus]MTI16510.1 ABC transporter permease [Pseudovibrio flavus]
MSQANNYAAERMMWSASRGLLYLTILAGYIFLLAPIFIVVVASFTNDNYLLFPPKEFSLHWYYEVFSLSWFRSALLSSLVISVISTTISAAIGIFVARALARIPFRGKALVELVVLSPLLLPSVVLGFALFNFAVYFAIENNNFINLVAGHVLITIPFVVRSVWAAMAGADVSLEEASMSLGATPAQAFRDVVLPMARPGIIAGCILAFTYSFNDVTLSIFLAGSNTTTLPVQMMSHIETSGDPSPAAISSLMVGLTMIFFVIIAKTVGLKIFTDR